jgi:NADH-quinone oxidoreductase subunit E
MLTEADKQRIRAEAAHFDRPQAASVEALKVVQERAGWVSDEDLKEVAELLEMSPSELDSVATFYNLIFREPVGKHVILVCDSVSCWIMGYESICEKLKNRLGVELGGTTADGKFTLLPMCCLGTCDRAPAMMVGSDLHRDLNPEEIDRILESYAD